MDLRDLDRRAMDGTAGIIARVKPEHLTLPTPCSDWTLRGLLRHLVNENTGFAIAARDGRADHAGWNRARLGHDPLGAYRESADRLTAAFAQDGALDGRMEVREFGTFPMGTAISMHFVDFLVHGWDVAVAIGEPYEPDAEMVERALAIASRWPDSPGSRGPGAAFDDRVPVPEDAPALHRLLGQLGRSPDRTGAAQAE